MADTELLSVSCNHCGAPLQVPASLQFLTCTYCGSRLEVHRANGAAYTQVLEAIDERTQKIAADVAEIKARERLEQIDREWMIQRERFMVRDKQGSSIPSTGGAVIGSIVVAVFGIFWTIMAISMGAPCFVPLFGVFFVVMGIANGISASNKAAGYSSAEAAYQEERDRALSKLRSDRRD
jgi:hypothetical protein